MRTVNQCQCAAVTVVDAAGADFISVLVARNPPTYVIVFLQYLDATAGDAGGQQLLGNPETGYAGTNYDCITATHYSGCA